MRVLAIAALALGLAAPARADDGPDGQPADAGVEARARPRRRADHANVQLGLGAGSDAAATALAELRAGYTRPGIAIELAARVRWQRGAIVREDWDRTGDWLGLLRRLELAHEDGGVAGALAAGRLAPVDLAAVVDGHATAGVLDRRAPGVTGRLASRWFAFDALIDDVTAPTLIAGGAELAIAGPWRAAAALAVDPGLDRGAMPVAADGQLELGARRAIGPIDLGGALIAGARGDLAGVVRGAASVQLGRVRASGRLELRAYGAAAVAAPFGPLSPIEREQMAVTGGGGVATALAATVAVDGLGELAAGVRSRGVRGDLVTARLALPWWRQVQAGAYAAIGVDAAIAAAEARVAWTPRWFSAVEAGRGYRRAGDGELAALWHATAWFGAAAGW